MKQATFIKFRDIMLETVQENSRKNEFVRIYPARNSCRYDKYFNKSSLNKVLYKVLFTSEFFPYSIDPNEFKWTGEPRPIPKQISEKPHRIQSATGTRATKAIEREEAKSPRPQAQQRPKTSIPKPQQTAPQQPQTQQVKEAEPKAPKTLITGDDILIEYVHRTVNALGQLKTEESMPPKTKNQLEKFITHYIWHQADVNPQTNEATVRSRLKNRLQEMTERRRRLIKYMYKKEENLDKFEADYPVTIVAK